MTNEKISTYIIALPFAVMTVAVFTVVTALIEGYVTMRLWSWFVSPLGVTTIGYGHAIGISVIMSHLTIGISPESSIKKHIFRLLVRPFFFLLIGYVVVKIFM